MRRPPLPPRAALGWVPVALALTGTSGPAKGQEPPARAVLEVGRGRPFETIGAALQRSMDGDTIRIHGGVYRERLTVRTAVTLVGIGRPVVDGGGRGTVLTVEAPAAVRGLEIRASGADQSKEDAGILVREADGVRLVDNVLTDVLFGIYVKQSRGPVVRDNRIEGKDLPVPRRGDGIRLWYCAGGVVEGNHLRRTRDLVIWFTSGLEVRRNRVTHGRYGLHYMYSDHNVFEGNIFARNDVGAFLMYSKDIRLRDNRFERAAGASAMGIGLKDADDIVAEDNVIAGNKVGIFIDNSPSTVDGRNRFRRNLLAANGTGVQLLPNVRANEFADNAWIGNGTPVAVSGGGDGLANDWRGNHWSDYAGFDEDGDGTGDTPFRHDRWADDLFARHPDLRLFAGSPAVASLDVLARLFPLLAPRPVVIDSAPALNPPAGVAAGPGRTGMAPRADGGEGAPGGHLPAALLLWTASVSAALGALLLTRRRAA